MRIDLNADIGESFGVYTIGEDQALFQHITSANIACGFHAGDFNVIRETVKSAKEHGVAIGAHPGYPDLQGFGRRELQMTAREIYNCVVYQIGALKIFCEIQGEPLQHVKPHGALYNAAAQKSEVAEAVAEAVYDSAPDTYLFGLANSKLIDAGQKLGLKVAAEAFADRRYTDDGQLCSRTLPGSVLHTYEEILSQVKELIWNGRVKTQSGQWLSLQADTICFHGDGKNAALYSEKIRKVLEDAGVLVRSVGKPI
jgi:UPF0271 protein